jgi:hypothetical protein
VVVERNGKKARARAISKSERARGGKNLLDLFSLLFWLTSVFAISPPLSPPSLSPIDRMSTHTHTHIDIDSFFALF